MTGPEDRLAAATQAAQLALDTGDVRRAVALMSGVAVEAADQGNLPSAIVITERNVELLAQAGLTDSPELRTVVTFAAQLNKRVGRWAVAEVWFRDAIRLWSLGVPDPIALAGAEAGLGECLYHLGAWSAAVPYLRRSADGLVAAGHAAYAAHLLVVEAEAHSQIEDSPAAAAAAGRALELAEATGQVQLAHRARQLLILNSEHSAATVPALARLRDQVDVGPAAEIDEDIAILLRRQGDLTAARSHIERARNGYAAIGDDLRVANCDLFTARLDQATGNLERARQLAVTAAGRFAALRTMRKYVEAMTFAAPLVASDDHVTGLGYALIAVAAADELRMGLEARDDREYWAHTTHNDARAVALELAQQANDVDTELELIETARRQGVPGDAVAGCVAVGGLSRLHTVRQQLAAEGLAAEPPTPRDLEAMAVRAGGAGAWWLGTWLAREQTLWTAVVDTASGRTEGGPAAELGAESALNGLVRILYESLPLVGEDEPRDHWEARMSASVLRHPDLEAKLATALGRMLLPPLLRDHLATAPTRTPVVIAPCPLLAYVPWPLLAIDDAGTRLVERADVVIAPAVNLLARLEQEAAAGIRGVGGPGPVRVVVADPAGDLHSAVSLADAYAPTSTAVVRGPAATPTRLRATLADLAPGADGAAVFACHARAAPSTEQVLCLARDDAAADCPLGASCCGGSPLAATALFDRTGPRLPGRVLLGACDSAGASLAGSAGEWTGLAPAVLWAGARLVVATLWPILDNQPSAAFERSIVDCLATSPDPVADLNQLGRDALVRWRAGDLFAAPLYWASYAAIGLRHS